MVSKHESFISAYNRLQSMRKKITEMEKQIDALSEFLLHAHNRQKATTTGLDPRTIEKLRRVIDSYWAEFDSPAKTWAFVRNNPDQVRKALGHYLNGRLWTGDYDLILDFMQQVWLPEKGR